MSARATNPFPDRTPYASEWAKLRRMIWARWLMFLTYLPVMAGLMLGFERLFGKAPLWFGLSLFFCWATCMVWLSYKYATFPCPRCQRSYFRGHLFTLSAPAFIRKCQHCKLPRGAVNDFDPREQDT